MDLKSCSCEDSNEPPGSEINKLCFILKNIFNPEKYTVTFG